MRDNHGQTNLPEYVVIFFLVIAAMVAMTVYVQRALQARVRDANHFMVDMASEGCRQMDAKGEGRDCKSTIKGKDGQMAYEYEPYYAQVNAMVTRDESDNKRLVGLGTTGAFRRDLVSIVDVQSQSVQGPPKDAN